MLNQWQREAGAYVEYPDDAPVDQMVILGSSTVSLSDLDEVPECHKTHPPYYDRRQCLACVRRTEWVRERLAMEKRAARRGDTEPEIVNLADLLAEPDEDQAFLVETVWPEGANVLLSAPAKVGKTTMRNDLVRSLVDGVPFLGTFEVPRPVERVVFLDFEMSRGQIRTWMRGLGIDRADRVAVAPLRGQAHTLDLSDPERRRWWIERLRGADVVILDCLEPVIGALGLDPNQEVRSGILEPWSRLMVEAGVGASLVIHHHGHGSDRAKGDSGILAWPDVIWQYTQKEIGGPRFLRVYGRIDDELPASLVEREDEGRLQLVLGVDPRAASARVEASANSDSLLRALLADHRERVDRGETPPDRMGSVPWEGKSAVEAVGKRACGWGKGTTGAAISDLESADPPLLVHSKAGKAGTFVYRLTPPALARST